MSGPTPNPFDTLPLRWSRSADIGELVGALAKAQGAFETVAKDREAKVKTKNGGEGYSYTYATLASVQAATRPALAANGLALVQMPSIEDGLCVVDALLAHTSGQWLACQISAPVPNDGRLSAVQSVGSVVTYLKRYQWSALCGVSSQDEDDDAQEEAPSRRRPASRQRVEAAPADAPVDDVPFLSAEERAAAEAMPRGDSWAGVVDGALRQLAGFATVAELANGMTEFETVGASDEATNAVRRACMRRMIEVATSPAELAVAAKLGKVTTAPEDWHAETKRFYTARAASFKAAPTNGATAS